MKNHFQVGEVVQFVENHKWCGCLGIINEVKDCGEDYKYLVGVPIPEKGIAYIFSMGSSEEFEYVGDAILAIVSDKKEE